MRPREASNRRARLEVAGDRVVVSQSSRPPSAGRESGCMAGWGRDKRGWRWFPVAACSKNQDISARARTRCCPDVWEEGHTSASTLGLPPAVGQDSNNSITRDRLALSRRRIGPTRVADLGVFFGLLDRCSVAAYRAYLHG